MKRKITFNTLALYSKTAVNTIASIYMVRLVLEYLGEYNFGVYSVVAGVVVLFGFISSSLSSATQRFFAFELARENTQRLSDVFAMFLNIYFLIAFILIIASETLGAWFIENHLNIDFVIKDQAIAVLRVTVLSFIITMIRTPFLGYIIAKEKMHIIALLGVIEPILKLILICYLLYFTSYESKLIAYSNTILVSSLITSFLTYYFITKLINFRFFKLYWDKKIFEELSSYTGWSLIGALIGPLNNQGVVLLLNFFFNPNCKIR